MFLTQLRLDPRHSQARRDLSDAYEMHRTLSRAFVSSSDQTPAKFLWRLQANASWTEPVILVQSTSEGSWDHLCEQNGYLLNEYALQTKAIDIERLVTTGAKLRFRLSANPTVTRDGKRLGLIGEESQVKWLERKGNPHGFKLEMALVSASDVIHCRKGASRITLRRATFDGLLRVSDKYTFVQSLHHGIGHGKAFGCGLMSIAIAI